MEDQIFCFLRGFVQRETQSVVGDVEAELGEADIFGVEFDFGGGGVRGAVIGDAHDFERGCCGAYVVPDAGGADDVQRIFHEGDGAGGRRRFGFGCGGIDQMHVEASLAH